MVISGLLDRVVVADFSRVLVMIETFAAINDRQFRALCDCLGLSHLADESQFATNAARVAHREQLTAELVAVLRTRGAEEWFAALTGAGVRCVPINDVADGVRFAASLGLEPIVDVEGSAQVANLLRLSATAVSCRHRPPALGEDEKETLAWLEDPEGAELGVDVR